MKENIVIFTVSFLLLLVLKIPVSKANLHTIELNFLKLRKNLFHGINFPVLCPILPDPIKRKMKLENTCHELVFSALLYGTVQRLCKQMAEKV